MIVNNPNAGKMAIAWRFMRRYRTSQLTAAKRLGISQPALHGYIKRMVPSDQWFDKRETRGKVLSRLDEF